MAASKAAQRRAKALSMASTRARRAEGLAPETNVSHSILVSDKARLDRLARFWGTQKAYALMGALRLAENQLVSGLDAEARARYFADSVQ